jgi:hypothetical protein
VDTVPTARRHAHIVLFLSMRGSFEALKTANAHHSTLPVATYGVSHKLQPHCNGQWLSGRDYKRLADMERTSNENSLSANTALPLK